MKNIFHKMILAVLSAALVFAAFPVTSVFAQSQTPPTGDQVNAKLEQAWARQLANYEKLGKRFSDTDVLIAKFQAKIDKAAANGKDVTAVQAALTAFASALKSGKPTYDSMGGIVTSHQGFDASGKVSDAAQAKATVQEFRAKMKELQSTMNGTGKALREALQAFRDANKPATARDS